MNAEPARLLSEALRSGRFIQGKHAIVCKDGTRCCLGVATAIAPPECSADVLDLETILPAEVVFSRNRHDSPLTSRGYDVHIPDVPGTVRHWLGITEEEESELVRMNDSGCTFEEIASYIDSLLEGRWQTP